MKGKRFTDEQITYALRRAEGGTPVADVCRQFRESLLFTGIRDGGAYGCKRRRASPEWHLILPP